MLEFPNVLENIFPEIKALVNLFSCFKSRDLHFLLLSKRTRENVVWMFNGTIIAITFYSLDFLRIDCLVLIVKCCYLIPVIGSKEMYNCLKYDCVVQSPTRAFVSLLLFLSV